MTKKIILAGLVTLGSVELSAYTYEVSPLIGKNFTESSALVDDSTAYGIRINKYISEDNAIMFGYTRMNNVDYKRGSATKVGKSIRSCNAHPSCQATNTSTNGTCTTNGTCGKNVSPSNDTSGSTTENSNIENSSADNGKNGGTGNTNAGNQNTAGTETGTGTGVGNLGASRTYNTDINRFYINGLHNIKTQYSRLVPYVYGGFGYEHVENEFSDNDSQGFFNAGGGLKFKVNDRFSLISDIQGVKKFNSHDFDILGSVGIGYLFGSLLQPEPEVAVIDSGLEDVQPKPKKREITVIKVAPQAVVDAPIVAQAPKGEYYVQIAAGFKTNMETGCKHTRDLRKAGIDYDIKYTTIKGKNAALVVVGPFETKEEAKAQLPKLRKFSKDAFVKRIKN